MKLKGVRQPYGDRKVNEADECLVVAWIGWFLVVFLQCIICSHVFMFTIHTMDFLFYNNFFNLITILFNNIMLSGNLLYWETVLILVQITTFQTLCFLLFLFFLFQEQSHLSVLSVRENFEHQPIWRAIYYPILKKSLCQRNHEGQYENPPRQTFHCQKLLSKNQSWSQIQVSC